MLVKIGSFEQVQFPYLLYVERISCHSCKLANTARLTFLNHIASYFSTSHTVFSITCSNFCTTASGTVTEAFCVLHGSLQVADKASQEQRRTDSSRY